MECLRCGSKMKSIGVEQIQLGEAGFITGSWSNILSGALEVEIKICGKCGKVEFFSTEFDGSLEQIECPFCNETHDMNDEKCPHCGKALIDNSR